MDWLSVGAGAINSILIVIYILLALFTIGAIIAIVWYQKSFKIQVIIKEVVNGGIITKISKGKKYTDKEKLEWLKLYKYPKEKIPFPQQTAFDIDEKGRKVITLYKTDNGFTPIKFNIKNEDIEPLTQKQRSLLINELRKAEKHKKKTIAEMIGIIAPSIAIIVIVIFAFLGLQSHYDYALQHEKNTLEFQKEETRIMSYLNQIIMEKQILSDEGQPIQENTENIPQLTDNPPN